VIVVVNSNSFVTSVRGNGYFNLPPEKKPTNKFLKRKDDDRPLAEKVLGKVFSEYKREKPSEKDTNTKK
jgi:hypothetical protein